jgi:hypothetical protein
MSRTIEEIEAALEKWCPESDGMRLLEVADLQELRDWIVHALLDLAYSDIRQLYTDSFRGPVLKPMSEWPQGAAHAVQSITFDKDGNPHLKMHPKGPARKLLRRLGIYGLWPPGEESSGLK